MSELKSSLIKAEVQAKVDAEIKKEESTASVPIDHDLDPRWNSRELAWESMKDIPYHKRRFFEHLFIAEDGGLSEIGTKDDLWYSSRYFSSVILIFFVVYNIYFLLITDVGIIAEPSTQVDTEFLLSKVLLASVLPDQGVIREILNSPKKTISLLELIILMAILVSVSVNLAKGYFCTGWRKWSAIAQIFWEELPNLSSFSAIKLLQFVTPQQFSYDLNYILWYDWAAWKMAYFVISRPLALIVGLDCFLIKYRAAQVYILSNDPSFSNIMGAIILLNQVLGVVQVSKTIRRRLYRFVFAGEDGIMSDREKVRQDTWEAMVAEAIFKMYSLDKALALMSAFNDDDFQMLALNEDDSKA